MHSDFPALNNANKMLATTGGTKLRGYRQTNTTDPNLLQPHYLGPLIIAQKDRPVRIKFTNSLPTGAGGNLFLPVDTTIMGSGPFEINYDPATKDADCHRDRHFHAEPRHPPSPWRPHSVDQRRHAPPVDHPGGRDHRTTPRASACKNVPDMPDPGPRVADILLDQPAERQADVLPRPCLGDHAPQRLCRRGRGIPDSGPRRAGPRSRPPEPSPSAQIPLVIQDKTFVDGIRSARPMSGHRSHLDLGNRPRERQRRTTPVTGDLWWPHVYMPAQNPFNPDVQRDERVWPVALRPLVLPADPDVRIHPRRGAAVLHRVSGRSRTLTTTLPAIRP